MKFIKGVLWGGLISAGMWMMHNKKITNNNQMIKKGKQLAKKLGIV